MPLVFLQFLIFLCRDKDLSISDWQFSYVTLFNAMRHQVTISLTTQDLVLYFHSRVEMIQETVLKTSSISLRILLLSFNQANHGLLTIIWAIIYSSKVITCILNFCQNWKTLTYNLLTSHSPDCFFYSSNWKKSEIRVDINLLAVSDCSIQHIFNRLVANQKTRMRIRGFPWLVMLSLFRPPYR